MTKSIIIPLGAALVLLILYLLFWPVPIDPAAWNPPAMPPLAGVYQENSQLCGVERLAKGFALGPEDVAFDAQGRLYSGMADGRIFRFAADGSNPELLAQTGGRPLGLAFDADGVLIVADAFKGLLANSQDGTIRVLTDEVQGGRINFADGLDIAADGTIFFTEASKKFTQDQFLLDLYEHRANGRLLAYDPAAHSTRVIHDNLYFANGVAVSPDQSYLLVSETSAYHIQRYWLRGPRKGQAEVFIDNLPGMPDNIHSDGHDTFWVGIPTGPRGRQMTDSVMPVPFVRQMLLRLPQQLRPAIPRSGYVLAVSSSGSVEATLQDPVGQSYTEITTAREHVGMLYLGSSSEDGMARLPVPFLTK